MPYNEIMTVRQLRPRSLRKIFLQALFLLGLSVVVGLGRNALSTRPLPLLRPYNPLSADTLGIRTLDSLQTREAWEKRQAIFLDARREELFQAGHVPGAKNLSLDDFPRVYPLLALTKDSAYVIYCEGKTCEYSHLLAERLYGLGYRKLSLFPGGWEEWTLNRYPVEK
jgi:rhodanese-related sulfurtransferase